MSEALKKIGVDVGTGWLPDYPDYRDFGPDQSDPSDRAKTATGEPPVKDMLKTVGVPQSLEAKLRPEENLKDYFPPVEDQGYLRSCTAQAGVGLVEYYEKRTRNRHTDASKLFLYKATRNLLGLTGDTGASIRTTMGAMTLFGVPPEAYWPYNIAEFDEEPTSFCYAFAQSYQALQYFRLDPPGTSREQLLQRIKVLITYGLPSMFGFTVFSSYRQARTNGRIPYPHRGDGDEGGHAVVAAGYRDDLAIKNKAEDAEETRGALFIRNSWGTDWGEDGYGWLPYKYVLSGLAVDWWCLLKSEWVATKELGIRT